MKIQKQGLADQVKDVLLDRIVKGRYKPGERLVELTIAKELEVSQAPVREAFQRLEAMRFVESSPNRGTFVREITDREMGESTIVRGVLEEAAARGAAKVLKNSVDELRAEVKAMTEALNNNDFEGVARHNVNFHRTIVHASENQVLIDAWESLAFEAKSRLCAQKAAHAVMFKGVKSCEPIVDAFARGDGETAGRMLRLQTEEYGVAQATASIRITPEEMQKALAAAAAQRKA